MPALVAERQTVVTMSVRTRYAPSPTGDPHVGNIRTAVFAWAFARADGGQFRLRIEDTDQSRLQEGSVGAIYESLRWLGITWDEGPDVGGPHGPYVQSERLSKYQAAAATLIAEDKAYRCFCTAERLAAMRAAQEAAKRPPGYDRSCAAIPPAESERRAQAERFTVRFRMKREGTTTLHDIVRGDVTFENALQDDFVALKSDGFPTYHLALIVDDTDMGITHAIRGEEWLSSAPKHLQLYEALGLPPTEFAHLPLILGADRKKLSKRTGDTALLDYARNGYLPDAMLNFLVLLGWSLDDRTTVISRDQLLANFSLDRVVPNPAMFDLDRLNFLNQHYIKQLSDEEWLHEVSVWVDKGLPADVPRPLDGERIRRAAPLLRERAHTLSAVAELAGFLFTGEAPAYEAGALHEKTEGGARGAEAVLDAAMLTLGAIPAANWSEEAIETAIRGLEEPLGQRLRKSVSVLYVAIMGRGQGIPLFDSMAILGKDQALARLRSARARLA